jgi:serine/threonine protein kinase
LYYLSDTSTDARLDVADRKPPQSKVAASESSGAVLAGRFVVDRVIVHRPLVIAYRAWDIRSSRPVILELLDESLVHDPELMPRLRKEAERSTTIVHDNILAFQGLYEEDNNRVIAVRDYVDGTSVARFLTQFGGPLPLYEFVQVIEQASQGLQHAHRSGALHRAINPSNIWLRYDGRVLLAGFGLPSLADIGTEAEVDPAFLSPEQCSGQKSDHRTDLYSLAAVSFWMCTGQPLFAGSVAGTPGDTEWERICWEQVNSPAPFASKLNPDLSRDVAWVISRGLAKRPEERFRSVAEYAAVMKRAMQESGLDVEAMLAEPPRWKRDPQPIAPPRILKPDAQTPKRPEAVYWLVGLVLFVAAIWGILITLLLNRGPLLESTPGAAALSRAAAAVDTFPSGGPLPTWTPPIIAQPTATHLPVLLAPPQPTQGPSIPGDLPYDALKPLTDLFDWDAYASGVSWRAYTDPHFGFALTYPAGWSLEQSDNVLRLYMPERDAAVVVCSCGTRVADSSQWAERFLELLRRDFGEVRQLDQQRYNDRWLATLAQIPQGGDDIQIALLSSAQAQAGFDLAFIAWSTDWQGIKPIFNRMAREMRFP